MSQAIKMLPIRATVSGRWQIPLLGIGLLILAGGLLQTALGHPSLSPEEKLTLARRLIEADALNRANAYLMHTLKEEGGPPNHRGELHRLLAVTIYRAESPIRIHTAQNVRSILDHFQAAVRLGVIPSATDWVAWGDAYRWSDEPEEAIGAYRRALRLLPQRQDRIRRKIVELRSESESTLSAETLGDLDAILADESASPVNYRWALERKVEWALEQGNTAGAMALVAEGKRRLAGTAEWLAVRFPEAQCLHQAGLPMEAEALLRSLRNDWTTRDELWGKAGWLLGRLQQEDDRPQAALSFYEEVLRSFRTGDLHVACKLGRAECLAMLERFDASLALFSELKDLLLAGGYHWGLDREVVRATLTTIGLPLLKGAALSEGVEYLKLALALADPEDRASRAWYMTQIAAGLSEIARRAAADGSGEPGADDTGESSLRPRPGALEPWASESGSPAEGPATTGNRASQLFAQAAEMYLALSELQTADETAAARSVELAADNFDLAGMEDRTIELLARFVVEHPTSDRRLAALYRLGQAYQAARRYDKAIAAYDEAIRSYPRLPAALRSMVPLAQCLIRAGGDGVQRGVDLLISIVDDRSDDPLFTPQAREYRDALFRLAEYYSHAVEEQVPLHFEKAIARLEDAIAFYPDDPEMPKMRFLLADAYRQSAGLLREQKGALTGAIARQDVQREADRRLRRALAVYDEVIAALAPQDAESLTELERTYLRASYLYRGDCWFDLGEYERAIEAYREAAWRYENLPTAVSASMQIIHCYQRLGRPGEVRTALARLRWLLGKIPPMAFDTRRGMSPKQYWEAMVQRLEHSGVLGG